MRKILILAMTLGLPITSAMAQHPTMEEVLDSLYRGALLAQFCEIDMDPVVAERLGRTGYKLERALGIDLEQSYRNIEAIKSSLWAVPPDCSPGSDDIAGVYRLLSSEKITEASE